MYLIIELRLSNQKAAEQCRLFGLSLTETNVKRIKSKIANKYTPTYRGILESDQER